MDTTDLIPQEHSVLAFLLSRGYAQTAKVFQREAAHVLQEPLKKKDEEEKEEEDFVQQFNRMAIPNSPNKIPYYSVLKDSFQVNKSNVLAVAIEPHSKTIISSATDKSVTVSKGRLGPPSTTTTTTTNTTVVYCHHTAPVLSIDIHPHHPNLVLTTSMDGTSVIINTDLPSLDTSSGIHQQFHHHQRYVVRGLFSPTTGAWIATASYDRTVCIYHTQDTQDTLPHYTLVHQWGPFKGNVEALCFLSDTVVVAGIRDDHCLHALALASLSQPDITVTKYNLNANGDDWVSFSPVWLPSHGRLLLLTPHASHQIMNCYDVAAGETGLSARRHAWDPSGQCFYCIGGDSPTVRVMAADTGECLQEWQGHAKTVRCLAVDPEGGLVTGGYDHCINVWQRPTRVESA
ncbi:WD40-repeat-containing domain protein [Spinellus fusiger]|nr:WD40-repeat-containing domain protein [Spinellus fusiger]